MTMDRAVKARIKRTLKSLGPNELALLTRVARMGRVHVASTDVSGRMALAALITNKWATIEMDHVAVVTDAGRVAFAVLQESTPAPKSASAKGRRR